MRTIKSSGEIDRVFQSARRVPHPLLIALAAQTPPGRGRTGRVAFIAGKRLGGAVVRNRSKRVLREAVRRANGPWAGYDIVLIARDSTRSAKHEELDRALRRALERADVT